MKDALEYILRNSPQPIVFATIGVVVTYFAIYYQHSYTSHGDAFRDSTFRSAAIVIFAGALLYSVNENRARIVDAERRPVLIVPKFSNDVDNKWRAPFIATVEAALDKTVGRAGTVEQIHWFITDDRAAKLTLDDYQATAIIFDASVSSAGGRDCVCFKLLTRESGLLARLAPVPLADPNDQIDRLVRAIAGQLSTKDAEDRNPLWTQLREIETRLASLESAIAADEARPLSGVPFPSYSSRHAVIVGLDSIAGSATSVRFARSDAEQVSQVLGNAYGFQTTTLLDSDATKEKILSAIRLLADRSDQQDVVLFYFAGNATQLPKVGEQRGSVATLMPYDFDYNSRTLSLLELLDALRALPAKHKVVLLDTCHATAGLSGTTLLPRERVSSGEPVLQVLAACKGDEYSFESNKGGVFTQALLEVLRNAEKQGAQGIWMPDVYAEVNSLVHERGFSQTTQLITIEGNGVFAWLPTVAVPR